MAHMIPYTVIPISILSVKDEKDIQKKRTNQMIEEKCIKILGRYLRVSSVYGFVRGWNADYEYNGYSKEITHSTNPNSLMVHRYMKKMIDGTMNGILYGTFGNPHAVYRCLCRIEIATTDKDPYDYPEYYTEVYGGIITLPPRPSPKEKD